MTVKTYWYDTHKTILMQVYEGRCDATDFHTSVVETHQQVSSVSHTVDIIVDMTKATFVGTSFFSVRGTAESKTLDNQRLAILVGAPTFIRSIVKIGKTIAPKTTRNLHFSRSIEEAETLIDRQSVAAR
jgi:hypothetical protein